MNLITSLLKTHFGPVARTKDPAASFVAGDLAQEKFAHKHRQLLLGLIKDRPGLTTKEMARYCTLERHQIARRTSELRRAGLVHHCSSPYCRGCEHTGKAEMRWWSVV